MLRPLRLLRFLARPLGWVMAARQLWFTARLKYVVRRVDAFDAIANMFLAVAPVNTEPGDGTDSDRLLAVPELAAMFFAERRDLRRESFGSPTSPSFLQAMHVQFPKLLHSAVLRSLGQLIPQNNKTAQGEVPSRLTHAAISREVYLRLPRFIAKERELLDELFTSEIKATVVERLGFGPDAMFALYDSLHSYVPQAVAERIRAANEEFSRDLELSPEFATTIDHHPGGIEDARSRIVTAYGFSQLCLTVSLNLDDLTRLTGVDGPELEAAMSRLSIDLDAGFPGARKSFLSGDNVMRTRPFVSRIFPSGERRWLIVQPTWLIFGMRELFEETLLAQPIDQQYSKHRGDLLERRGMAALVGVLKPDIALVNVEYKIAGRAFEADGVLILGHMAIVLEAKSNRLTTYARAGAPVRLWRELGPIITKAASQAERLRAVLLSNDNLHVTTSSSALPNEQDRAPKRNWDLNLERVTDVLTIALTLEDLNFIVTITSDLTQSGIIPAGVPAPWVVNIHDLEIAAKLLASPAAFAHFLIRRRDAALSGRVMANDELDYVMHYLTFGLHDPPDGAVEFVANLTPDLDAWYFYETGERQTPAPRPRQPIGKDLDEMLDALSQARPFGWLLASISLLELRVEARDQVAAEPRRLRNLTQRDRHAHSMFFPVPSGLGFVVISFEPGESISSARARLFGYATLRRYASKYSMLFAFGTWQRSRNPFDIFICLAGDWEFDEVLERAASQAGLALRVPHSPARDGEAQRGADEAEPDS